MLVARQPTHNLEVPVTQIEIVIVNPESRFWYALMRIRNREVDDNGDPLELMIRAEEGDEVALDLMRGSR